MKDLMHSSKTTSIKEYSIKYAIIIFVVIFFVAVIHYLAYSHYLKGVQENEYKKSLAYTANNVTRTVNFYQSFVNKVASQAVVADLLQFGTNEEIQAWSNKMQRLVPESVGLTLFNAKGQAQGLSGELRLSERCLNDMDKRFRNLPIPKPPVHHKIEELAHFDVVSPVIIDGENIGLVFVSFSLDTIKRLLADVNTVNEGIRISTTDNFEIASVGNLKTDKQGAYIFKRTIDNTDWEIELSVVDEKKGVLLTSLLVSNILAFILLSFTLYVSMKKLFSIVMSDFEMLSWIMNSIKEGTYDPKKVKKIFLKEAQHIFTFIQYTAVELMSHQDKLKQEGTTDELTGLYNRRVLNSEIDNCLQLANKGSNFHLTILDLDYFKDINDTHGHDVGDDILVFLSEGLVKNSKATDVCTRSGGDEFIVILKDYEFDQVKCWYQSMVDYMNERITQYALDKNIEIKFGISAGCSLIRNNDMKSTVLKRADEALYRVKERGRGDIECL